jgi:hypothetical protein
LGLVSVRLVVFDDCAVGVSSGVFVVVDIFQRRV